MYEENRLPLPAGDFLSVFALQLSNLRSSLEGGWAPDHGALEGSVRRNDAAQRQFADVCRRLLLPGSRVQGLEHLTQLAEQAAQGNACLLCLNHTSNLDVPTLRALLEDQGDPALFDRIIWIAGRKLGEDCGLTPVLADGFQRLVVTPRSWFREAHSEAEREDAHRMNMRAYRAMRRLRQNGWVFGLFPAGTRRRPDDDATARAVDETDSYLKYFDYAVLGRIDGCTLPPVRDRDMSRETPRCDRVVYTFGPLLKTSEWRADAARRHSAITQRAASAVAIMEDIAAIHGGSRSSKATGATSSLHGRRSPKRRVPFDDSAAERPGSQRKGKR